MRVLCQEGVRVVVVADTQPETQEIIKEFNFVNIIDVGGIPKSAARSLRSTGYTWPADLRALRPRFTRRHLIAAATFATFTGITGVVLDRYIIPHSHLSSTPAMLLARDRRRDLTRLLETCRRSCAGSLNQVTGVSQSNPDLTRLEAFCRHVCPRDDVPDPKIDVWPLNRRPPEADHAAAGVEILARHVTFDCSEWQPLDSEKTTREVPIEASFSTSVFHFRRRKKGEIRIALELNSGGFGVVPLLEPGDELILGTKRMKEADRLTRTSYVVRTIPANFPDEFEVTVHSIYFNGFQDQQVRGKDSDWCAVRNSPCARDASLAFVKPKHRTIRSISKIRRAEDDQAIDLGVPGIFSQAAGEKQPDQKWYVWPIDVEDMSQPTVYSMRWKLEPQ